MFTENVCLPLFDSHAVRRNNPHMAKNTEKKNMVGPVIERRLRELGRSQVWLAEKLGLSPVSIHNWIVKGTISKENLGPCAIALDLTTAQLLGEDQPAPKTEAEAPPMRVSLQWLLPDEQELLEEYRLSTDEGKNMARSFVKVAPKKDNGGSNGQRHAA